MKKLFLILFIFLVSCTNTPEKKIIESFNNQRFTHNKNYRVQKVEIYDTVYIDQIINTLPTINDQMDIFQKKMERMNSYRDSILELNYSKYKRDSLLKIGRELEEYYDRELEHIIRREMTYVNMNQQIDNDICGYYARVITPSKTFNFIVTPITYKIICPVFIFED